MSLETLKERVLAAYDEIRDSLARIEDAAQVDETPALHALAQAYARLLAPLRDYLSSAQIGKPLPRQLARRVGEHLDPLLDHAEDARRLGLRPDADALTELIRLAETAT